MRVAVFRISEIHVGRVGCAIPTPFRYSTSQSPSFQSTKAFFISYWEGPGLTACLRSAICIGRGWSWYHSRQHTGGFPPAKSRKNWIWTGEEGLVFTKSAPPAQPSDRTIRNILDESRRYSLDSCVRALFKKNLNLPIHLNTTIGDPPPDKACSSNNSSQSFRIMAQMSSRLGFPGQCKAIFRPVKRWRYICSRTSTGRRKRQLWNVCSDSTASRGRWLPSSAAGVGCDICLSATSVRSKLTAMEQVLDWLIMRRCWG